MNDKSTYATLVDWRTAQRNALMEVLHDILSRSRYGADASCHNGICSADACAQCGPFLRAEDLLQQIADDAAKRCPDAETDIALMDALEALQRRHPSGYPEYRDPVQILREAGHMGGRWVSAKVLARALA